MTNQVLTRGTVLRGYGQCKEVFETRRKGRDYKVLSHNQILRYDAHADCYLHQHHNTVTVKVFPDRYQVTTGGWNTSTTWAKIYQMVPIRTFAVSSPYQGGDYGKAIRYDDNRVCQYRDGMEFDLQYQPLCPLPITKRVLRRGQRAEFYELVRKVTPFLVPRMLLGEFDESEAEPLSGGRILTGMHNLIARGNMFSPHDDLAPFFAHRPKQAFGRPIRQWGGVEEIPSAASRLASNLNAALQAWTYQHSNELVYDSVEVETL